VKSGIIVIIFIFLSGISFSGNTPAQIRKLSKKFKYVNSDYEYLITVILHNKRVRKLGLKMLQLFPDRFKNIDKEKLRKYLKFHDLEKFPDRFIPVPFLQVTPFF